MTDDTLVVAAELAEPETSHGSRLRLAWRQMPVMAQLRWRLRPERPLKGVRVAAALHVSMETAHLMVTLKDAGAKLLLHPSNPHTIEPAATAELERHRTIQVLDPVSEAGGDLAAALEIFQPDLLIDNGSLLAACSRMPGLPARLTGATVHSRSAEALVRAMLAAGAPLAFPVLSIAGSELKNAIETPAGTGQSTVVAVIRATGIQLSGKHAVVVGYGMAGTGIAAYLSAMRARVTVVDVSPVACLRAVTAGHQIDSLENAISTADLVLIATGSSGMIGATHLDLIPDGAVLGNIGHHPDAIDVPALRSASDRETRIAGGLTEYRLTGRSIYVLGEGNQLNHVCGDGNASELMDLTLSLHVHCLLHLLSCHGTLPAGLSTVPDALTEEVARTKLRTLGYVI